MKPLKVLIWQVRMDRGVTLEELSEMTGIGKTTINEIENQNRDIKLRQLEKIAKALDMKMRDLYESEYK